MEGFRWYVSEVALKSGDDSAEVTLSGRSNGMVYQDDNLFTLGELSAAPGSYCGIEMSLQPVGDESLASAAVVTAPCYYPSTVGIGDAAALAAEDHRCIEVAAGATARSFTLDFEAPLTLDTDHRSFAIKLVARYEEWFDGLDMSLLASDATQQSRLLDNIVTAMTLVAEDRQFVSLNFAAAVNGQQAVCGQTYDGIGIGAQQDLRMEGFRWYVSEVALKSGDDSAEVTLSGRSNGMVYQDDNQGVALLGEAAGCDGATPVQSRNIVGTVPAGAYDQVCFTLGVPFELNHSDPTTAPSPLNLTAMTWSWLSGRVFYRFDSIADPDGATPGNWFVHLGSTGCSNGTSDFGAPPEAECVNPNRPRICLPYDEVAAGHAIVADVAPLLEASDLGYNTPDTAPGCMSFPGDPECAAVMPRFGLDYTLYPGEVYPARTQSAFSVAP